RERRKSLEAEGVRPVARPAARRHQNEVEAEGVLAIGGMLHQPVFGGSGDAFRIHRIERVFLAGAAGAGLHLDKGNGAAALRNQVDLAHGGTEATRENAIELETEQERRDGFAPVTAALCGDPAAIAAP